MLIKSIIIKNLFGMFNYKLDFNLDDKITILYGPNGIGKTVILSLINNIFQKKFVKVADIKFDSIRFDLDNNSYFVVTRDSSKNDDFEINQLKFKFKESGGRVKSLPMPEYYLIEDDRERFFTYKKNILKRQFEEKKISEVEYESSMDELFMMRRYPPHRSRLHYNRNKDYREEKETFDSLFEKFKVKTTFIDTRRLYKEKKIDIDRNNTEVQERVVTYSRNLAERITEILKKYSSVAQEQEKTFPLRIIKQDDNIVLDSNDIQKQLLEVEEKRASFEELGILDKNDDGSKIKIPKNKFSNTKLAVLSEYIQDNNEKFKLLEDLASKITIFKTIIDKRFSNKEIYFNNEVGFYFTNRKGDIINTESLSSGEKHEIIMFYDFLFNIEEDTLIIIDEPELSLHVAWQVDFLKDYKGITAHKNNHLLIATHSPQLIDNSWNLCIDLEENCEYSD